MKLRKLANALLTCLLIVMLTFFANASCVIPTVNLSPASINELEAPTYVLNAYNQGMLKSLGVLDYNEYLQNLNQTTPLKTVTIAIIDSGLDDSNPIFNGRIVKEYARNFTSGDTTKGWNIDESGHGTHVAGIIADATLANISILPIRIFYSANNNLATSAYDKAINYVISLQSKLNIVAVNMSLGTDGIRDSTSNEEQLYIEKANFQRSIDRLRVYDILPVVAAGNINEKTEKEIYSYYSFPASCDGAVAVGSYNYYDGNKRSWFSYWNKSISLAAPGHSIWSVYSKTLSDQLPDDIEDTNILGYKYGCRSSGKAHEGCFDYNGLHVRKDSNGNWYCNTSGTSMATPFVTLCYAMLMSDSSRNTVADLGIDSWNSSVDTKSPYFYLTPQHKALLLHATDFGTEGRDTSYGYGGVNVSAFCVTPENTVVKITPDAETISNPKFSGGSSLDKEGNSDNWKTVVMVLVGICLLWVLLNYLRAQIINRRHARIVESTKEEESHE